MSPMTVLPPADSFLEAFSLSADSLIPWTIVPLLFFLFGGSLLVWLAWNHVIRTLCTIARLKYWQCLLLMSALWCIGTVLFK